MGSPVNGSTHESCQNWLKIYDNAHFLKSVFFKGPLLVSGSIINESIPLTSFISIRLYKNNVKKALLSLQSSGDPCEWQNNNFALYDIKGLRRSNASYRTTIDNNEQ